MGLSFDQRRVSGDCDQLFGSADLQFEIEFGGGSGAYLQRRCDLRGHVGCNGASGVLSGAEELEDELSGGIAGDEVAEALGRVDESDGSVDNRAARGVEYGAADGSGGSVLGEGSGGEQ